MATRGTTVYENPAYEPEGGGGGGGGHDAAISTRGCFNSRSFIPISKEKSRDSN